MRKYLAWTSTDQVCPRVAETAPHQSKQFSQFLFDCGATNNATTSPPCTTAAVGLPALPDYILAAAFASHSPLLAPPNTAPSQQPSSVQLTSSSSTTSSSDSSSLLFTASQLFAATNSHQDVTAVAVVAAAAQQLQQQVAAAASITVQPSSHSTSTNAIATAGNTHRATLNCTLTAAPRQRNVSVGSPSPSTAIASSPNVTAASVKPIPFFATSGTLSTTPSFVRPSAFSVVTNLAASCSSTSAQSSSPSSSCAGGVSSSVHQQTLHSSTTQQQPAISRALLEQVVQPARPQPIVHSVNIDSSPSASQQQVGGVHSQHMNTTAAAALYPQLMCLPVLLDRFGPHILRSQMNPAQFKAIPNNERVDLARFRAREPQDWSMEDVIAWMLDVAKRNHIPFEDLEMQKFASCTGPLLLLMTEQNFRDRDPNYGSLLFSEFRRLVRDESFIDDWMRVYKESEEEPQPSTNRVYDPSRMSASSVYNFTTSSPLSPSILLTHQQIASTSAQPQNASPLPSTLPSTSSSKLHAGASTSSDFDSPAFSDEAVLHGVNSKIKKNKDGKPRKRSQHTKGNKLWEFIRDALKDPSTCPSVVRWEDRIEGVFRIVESEKLARLWGEKKNNQKMTYEKLSRAMRTYYEKQILVPVPKTGLYPKKLVYKFGPSAHGWDAPLSVKMEHCA